MPRLTYAREGRACNARPTLLRAEDHVRVYKKEMDKRKRLYKLCIKDVTKEAEAANGILSRNLRL